MTHGDRQFLTNISAFLEREFPGVTAGFGDFVTSYLGGEHGGFLFVEVFNVAERDMEDVLRAAEERAFEHLGQGGGLVTFRLWSPEQTAQYFQDDVAAVSFVRISEGPAATTEGLEVVICSAAETEWTTGEETGANFQREEIRKPRPDWRPQTGKLIAPVPA